jgi:hypothetical protein
MPGADAVLIMVHAGRDNASVIDQLLSVATSRGQFSSNKARGSGKEEYQNKRGVEGVGGKRRIGGPVGVADPLR